MPILGFNAIGRIRIVQKPVARADGPIRPRLRKLSEAEQSKLSGVVQHIEDDGLSASLEQLGATILASRK